MSILQENIKGIKKEIKVNVPACKQLEKKAVQMNDILNIVLQLNDAKIIKKRHWKHLIQVTKKNIPFEDDEHFTIETLIQLEMNHFKTDVDDEKSIAAEQNKIEDKYNKIDKVWQSEKFRMTKELNKKTYDFYLFDHGAMEGVIETLEKHQNDLIQMAQKKGILENFENMGATIDNKLAQLKTINDVIKAWLKFQKNWEKLEVIFLKSEDIQNKLRNEYQEFQDLNIKFREEMKNAWDYNTMIDVCTDERKITILDLSEKISLCQKALDNYLETKKQKFPRFYFVSNDTLLNMLASADYPNLINKNIKDCFDGIKSWRMEPLDENNKSKIVHAMNSADNDEIVELHEPFECVGQLVEVYLGDFERVMKENLAILLHKCYNAVTWDTATTPPDKIIANREQWLNPFPAQLALLVTQIVWTEEVEHALDASDGGENGALKAYYNLIVERIKALVSRVRDEVLTRD